MTHLTEEQIFALVDGGIPPNQEPSLRSHLSGCSECRQSLDDVRQLVTDLSPAPIDEPAFVRQVMAGVVARGAVTTSAGTRRRRPDTRTRFAAAVAITAMAAGVLLVLGSRHREELDGQVAARGMEQAPTLSRNVGIRLLAGDGKLAPLADGSLVAPETTFVAAYTNLHPNPVHLIVFAVDAANVVHWLYPAYTRPDEDPPSVSIERSSRERVMPTSVVLDAPAEGKLRVLSLATEAPLRVSDIERRNPADLERASLEREFRGAATELLLEVRRTR